MSNQGGYGGRSAGWERGTGFGQGSMGGSYYDRGAGNYGPTSSFGGAAGYGGADRLGGQTYDRDRGWGAGSQEYGYGSYGAGRGSMDEGRFPGGGGRGERDQWQSRDWGRQDLGWYRGGGDDWRWNEQNRERGGGGGMMEKVGRFFGMGPKGYKRADNRIQEDVSDMLMDHPEIDATNIEVKVQDGEVTLEGVVEERRIKRLAEDVAERVRGVKEVHNRLRLQKQTHGTTGAETTGTTTDSGRTGSRESTRRTSMTS